MKIAFYHELHKGGARRGTNEFAKQLKNRGHLIDLYTIDKRKDETSFYSNIYGYKFTSKLWRGNDWKSRVYKDTIELLRLFLLNMKISSDINKKKYDLTYITASQYIESPFILNFLKSRKFYYLNDPYYRLIYEPELFKPIRKDTFRNTYEKLNRGIRKYIDKINISKVDYVLAASDFTGRQFQNIYKRKEWHTIYYGVDTNFFKPGKSEKVIDLLFIGSRDVLDGYPLFKDILKRLNIRNLNIREVLFENEWLSDKDIREIYQKTKILLAVSYNEPLGLIPLEAMACGVTVLAVNEGGYKETVVKGAGYLIGRDPDKFVDKINSLLKNNTLLLKCSEKSIKNSKNWSWNKRGEYLEKYLHKLTI